MHLQRWKSPNQAVTLTAQILPRAKQSTICLPSSLINATPTCALSCVLNFAITNYEEASCSHTSSLTFLCTQNTISGLTIGQALEQCTASFCVDVDTNAANELNICRNVLVATSENTPTVTTTIQPMSTSTVENSSPLTAPVVNPAPASASLSTPTQQATPTTVSTVLPDTPAASISDTSGQTQTFSPSPVLTGITSSSTASPVYSSGVAMPDQSAPPNALGTAQIVGISVASAATAILVLVGVVMALMLRKQRRNKRRSRRWSGITHPTPPPNYDGLGGNKTKNIPSTYPALTSHDPNQRFYAPPRVDDKRRSFWRKSIKPEDIGVAVSPKAFQPGSPGSVYSQKSDFRLLSEKPREALWPAPLDLYAMRRRQHSNERPESEITIFDEDLEAKVAEVPAISKARPIFNLEKPPTARKKNCKPPPLKLSIGPFNSFHPYASRSKDALSNRIPLTPTYDNGNIDRDYTPPRVHSQSPPETWQQILRSETPKNTTPEHKLRSSSTYANRNLLRKKSVTAAPLNAVRSPPSQIQKALKDQTSPQGNSIWSGPTNIDEYLNPEYENNKQVSNAPRTLASPIKLIPSRDDNLVSPIKELRYPAIPRSAAISSQAENIPIPRSAIGPPAYNKPLPPIKFHRDQLVRAEASFMQTDTTSSDGYLSDQSIEWPAPPAACRWKGTHDKKQQTLKSKVARLSENPASANRGTGNVRFNSSSSRVSKPQNSIDQVLTMQRANSNARMVPSKSRTGDLYLTVEM